VFFHNFGNYDVHFLVTALSSLKQEEFISKVDVIPKSTEKFLAMFIDEHLRFIDSFQFCASSLDTLVKNMKLDPTADFKLTKHEFRHEVALGADIDLLFKKGIYPYSFMTSLDAFSHPCLPDKKEFFNDLKNEEITDEQYAHAQAVWKSFKCKDLGDYHDLYNRLDVSLLADVMERTRHIMYDAYELDLPHFLSLPNMGWEALLKLTGVKLDLIKDPTMLAWFESSIRGGYVSNGSLRYIKSNNPYQGEGNYKVSEDGVYDYISFLDAVNLYGYSMSHKLPISEYTWLADSDPEEFARIQTDPHAFIEAYDEETNPYAYFFEVDLEYPPDKHDFMNDYPPAIGKRTNEAGEFCKTWQQPELTSLNINPSTLRTAKLIGDLYPKGNYKIHHSALKMYVEVGIKITKVKSVIKCRHEDWMKLFIDFNTGKRKRAWSKFEKDFWKLLNNR